MSEFTLKKRPGVQLEAWQTLIPHETTSSNGSMRPFETQLGDPQTFWSNSNEKFLPPCRKQVNKMFVNSSNTVINWSSR